MADANQVSKPPLQTAIVDQSGLLTRAWSVWFRDLYNRTSYKGGNAIDENKAALDSELLDVNSSLAEVIEQVNEDGTAFVAHVNDNAAHGANGDIVGFNDLAEEDLAGLVKRMVAIADGVDSIVDIVTDDLLPAPAAYDQAYTDLMATLTNENKAAVNQLSIDLNAAIAVLNNLLAESKASGQMTE